MFAVAPQRFESDRWVDSAPTEDVSHSQQTPAVVILRCYGMLGSASDCICKYLQSVRVWAWASIRCWWQFNWVVMATLVPGTSLQTCDSHSFIGNTGAPGARTETASKVLWPPLPCKDESSWPSCQLPLCLAGISCTWLENGSRVTERCSLMSGVGIISLSQNLFNLALRGTTTGSLSAIFVSSLSNNDKWLKPKRRAAFFSCITKASNPATSI